MPNVSSNNKIIANVFSAYSLPVSREKVYIEKLPTKPGDMLQTLTDELPENCPMIISKK